MPTKKGDHWEENFEEVLDALQAHIKRNTTLHWLV